MKQKQTFFIGIAAVVLVLLLFSSKMFYIIEPGERAVVFRSISGVFEKDDIVSTGLKVVAPWNKIFKYDVKEQTREEPMDVLDKNGLSISIDVTVRFNPVYSRIGYLHETFSGDYVNRLVIPEVRSTVRKVTGRYSAEEIYSTKRSEVELAIDNETQVVLEKNNVMMTALLIRSINLPTDIKGAIESKLKNEQEALAMKYINEKERLEAERKTIEAEGIASYNRIINSSLTDKVLTQQGIEATIKLSESPNAKVIVVGSSENGLPLILGNN